MWFHETSLEFSLGIKLYSKKSLSICLFIHISWEPFFCAICYFAAVLLRTKGSAVSKLGQFGNVTHSILIHLNTGLQCSVFIAPQPEAGLTRDLCHMISRWSRHKQNEDLCSTTCCCNPFEMRKKRRRLNKSVECLSVRRHSQHSRLFFSKNWRWVFTFVRFLSTLVS